MSLQDIVDVQISKVTSGVSRTGFGIPLVLTYHTKDAARVLEFTDASDMLVAGGGPFAASDMAYVLASKCFAQDPKPEKVLVGRRVWPSKRSVELTPLSGTINGETYPLNTTAYSVTIARDGTEETFTFTTDATATVAEITAGLVALINAGGVNVLATDGTTKLTIESSDTPGGTGEEGTPFTFSCDRGLMSSNDVTAVASGGNLADEIAAIQSANDEWYGICGDWFGKTEIEDVSDAIETLFKLHGCVSQDDALYDDGSTTDVGALLQSKSLARTFLFHHPSDIGTAAAMLGKNLPKDPGSITWKFKTLATVAVVEYTAGEKTALANKNVERYIETAGRNFTCDGKTSSGEFIDITRFVDWLRVRLQENIFFRLQNADKVPYTDPGVGVIENEVRGTLANGVAVGGLAADPAFTVTVPLVADVPAVDRANRLLPDVTFTATLAGAIHELEIRGVVTV